VECAVLTADYYYHILSIFDCYVCCTCLKSTAISSFGRTGSDALVSTKNVRVHRLDRATCLVAEVKCAFVAPLWSAFDTAIKA